MTRPRLEPIVRWTAFVAALGAAAAVLASFQFPRGSGSSDVDVRFTANLTGQLVVEPAGTVLRARAMGRGDRARGRMTIQNITDEPLAVRLRAMSSGHEVDGLLRLRIAAGRRTLFRGPLGELRHRTPRTLRLGSQGEATLTLRAWIPQRSAGGFRGRAEDVTLVLLSRRARR
jgi:hypothetical protein